MYVEGVTGGWNYFSCVLAAKKSLPKAISMKVKGNKSTVLVFYKKVILKFSSSSFLCHGSASKHCPWKHKDGISHWKDWKFGKYPLDLTNWDCWSLILASAEFKIHFCTERRLQILSPITQIRIRISRWPIKTGGTVTATKNSFNLLTGT